MENVKDQLLELMTEESCKITANLNEAKLKFANAHLNDEDWSVRGVHERNCQIYKGQLDLLEKLACQVTSIGA
jgi:hypothetical protein